MNKTTMQNNKGIHSAEYFNYPAILLGCGIIKINCRVYLFFDLNHLALEKDELAAQRTERQFLFS